MIFVAMTKRNTDEQIQNMKQETLQLTGGAGKNKRRELDFYPTPKECTVALLDFLEERYLINKRMRILEPACGEGAISKILNERYNCVLSIDIMDTTYAGKGIDYLAEPIRCDAVITNPPFDLSEKFIRKALKDSSNLVCMLLKSQYWHAAKRIDLFETRRPAFVLPLTWRPDFLEHERIDGKKGAPTMEVAWSVWHKGSAGTDYILLKKPAIVQPAPNNVTKINFDAQ